MLVIDEDFRATYANLTGVVVDAGHGGTDPGASGNGIVEKTYALDIAKRIADGLTALGIPVVMTRTTDETLTPEERVARVLNAFGDDPNVIVISNHLNAGGGDGAEAVYALRDKDTLARIILEEIAKEGQNIRKWYQRRLPSDTSKDYYFILRNTGLTEPVLVEYGFVDNATDAEFIKNNWQKLSDAVVRAIAIYKNIPYATGLEAGIYTVQSGDTLWSIAKKFNVGVTELKEANNLTTNTISLGQKLKIPGYVSPEYQTVNYVVQKGDNLYSIASAYNTTVDAIKSANNLTTNILNIGQQLKIPQPVSTTPTTPVTPATNTYTVQSGDTLYSIANKFGVTVTEIKNLNNLTGDTLSLGQILLIPVTQAETTTYTVQSGDNLYSIANKFGTTVDAIKSANNLTTNILNIGDKLIIPTTSITPTPSQVMYTVQKGDSLYSIASKYGVTTDQIIKANNLSSTLLSIGQELVIPTTQPITRTYTVQSGDSLYSIANKFDVTVDGIRAANGLTNDLLSIGQTLQIP